MGLATTGMAGTLFQSTPPARGATVNGQLLVQIPFISIHAPREGGDHPDSHIIAAIIVFQSTPPARGATRNDSSIGGRNHNFNPRPPRGGRRYHRCRRHTGHGHFNPRPPRGGRRGVRRSHGQRGLISIHAPREGGRLRHDRCNINQYYFNPRPPRGGRLGEVLPLALAIYFNPRPPRGGRPLREGLVGSAHPIFQSTPPARGATSPSSEISSHFLAFQSTPPARGATSVSVACMVRSIISIHAPREGGDRHIGYKFLPPERNFNPRPPRGGATRPAHDT